MSDPRSSLQPSLSRQAFNKFTALAGYYSRFMALRHLLLQFLGRGNASSAQPQQVLTLGAGYDTTFFQLEVRAKQDPGATLSCAGRFCHACKTQPALPLHAVFTARCNRHSLEKTDVLYREGSFTCPSGICLSSTAWYSGAGPGACAVL